jgi:hypothetical protein
MKILPNGYFSVEFSAEDLRRGLRQSAKAPRNSKLLTVCNGAVGKDGVLRTLDTLAIHTAISDAITVGLVPQDDFPFPQVFALEQLVILCNQTSILEYDGSGFNSKISGLTNTGAKWNISSAYGFVYLSNGQVSVTRSPETGVYSLNTTTPIARASCNYNGQFIVGYV